MTIGYPEDNPMVRDVCPSCGVIAPDHMPDCKMDLRENPTPVARPWPERREREPITDKIRFGGSSLPSEGKQQPPSFQPPPPNLSTSASRTGRPPVDQPPAMTPSVTNVTNIGRSIEAGAMAPNFTVGTIIKVLFNNRPVSVTTEAEFNALYEIMQQIVKLQAMAKALERS